jgi:hypothetical protein
VQNVAVKIPVAIETSRRLLVACLRAGGRNVYAINPIAVAVIANAIRWHAGSLTRRTRRHWPTSCARTWMHIAPYRRTTSFEARSSWRLIICVTARLSRCSSDVNPSWPHAGDVRWPHLGVKAMCTWLGLRGYPQKMLVGSRSISVSRSSTRVEGAWRS